VVNAFILPEALRQEVVQMNKRSANPLNAWWMPLFGLLCLCLPLSSAFADSTERRYESIKYNTPLLRQFLQSFPKGGELHTHIDGAVYAESYLAWAAQDGKCVDLKTYTIEYPPCSPAQSRPPVSEVLADTAAVNTLIDALSIRNYQLGSESGHDQFFATFDRFSVAAKGRQGDMLAEVAGRAGRQNVLYMELMDSQGMRGARALVKTHPALFAAGADLSLLKNAPAMAKLTRDTMDLVGQAEQAWHEIAACSSAARTAGCDVTLRYLAQVIRVFPRAEILAQTMLAFMLIEQDPRYVGLNFVAPEDHAVSLRDYNEHMRVIREVSLLFPAVAGRVTLHAGELALPLVAPEHMQDHIYQAVHVAGAQRIGHGVDIGHENDSPALVNHMAQEKIAVEINLTSNAVILGVEGDDHPFELYRRAGVPLVLSTDDEGVARIDLTHEYIKAAQTYNLSYDYLKELSRNTLAYSFLPGANLFADVAKAKLVKQCYRDRPGRTLSRTCAEFISGSEKSRLQWQLEERFVAFESAF
jgi:adenosine deaminase